MRRVPLEESDAWKSARLEKAICTAIHGESSTGEKVWYGSGRFFSLEVQFRELDEDSAKQFDGWLSRMVNFDDKRVLGERYRGMFAVCTQPMSLDYHRNRMPWSALFSLFNIWFEEQKCFIVKVDQRSLSSGMEERVSKFLAAEWGKFEEFCLQQGMEVGICAASLIEGNLEFRIFKDVKMRAQLLTVLELIDCICTLCEKEEEVQWSAVEERLKDSR